MSNKHNNPAHDADQPMAYRIRIKGHLGPQWADWFEGLTITLEKSNHSKSHLTGNVNGGGSLLKLRSSGGNVTVRTR